MVEGDAGRGTNEKTWQNGSRRNSSESVSCAWSLEYKPDLVSEKHGAEAGNAGMQVMGW